MQANYKAFIDRVIDRYEGGYSWDRRDPGGPTKYGVTCYDLAEHRHLPMNSMASWAPLVQNVTRAEAEDIYKVKYAKGVRFDELKSGIDCVMLDYAINSGVTRAIHVACAMVRHPLTNVIDSDLLKAINACNTEKFISDMCAERLRFMRAIDGGRAWITFGNGWSRRVADVRAYSLLVENGHGPAAPPAPDLSHVITPKAKHVAKTAGTKTTGGVVAGGAAAHTAGLPWYGVAAVVGTILIAGVVYEVWQDQKATAANLKVHL